LKLVSKIDIMILLGRVDYKTLDISFMIYIKENKNIKMNVEISLLNYIKEKKISKSKNFINSNIRYGI